MAILKRHWAVIHSPIAAIGLTYAAHAYGLHVAVLVSAIVGWAYAIVNVVIAHEMLRANRELLDLASAEAVDAAR